MMNPDSIVSVVAYLCNDAALLPAFAEETVACLAGHYGNFELILLDDHSTDNTLARMPDLLARYPGLRYLRLARHSGPEQAMTAGLDAALGDYVVVLRARHDPPREIPGIVAQVVREGGAALGTADQLPTRGFLVRWGRRLFYRLLSRLVRVRIPRNATGFCALTRPAVNAITLNRSKRRHLRLMLCLLGFPVSDFPYHPHPGEGGPAPGSLGQAFRDATALMVSSSRMPLRLVSSLGIVAGVINLLYILYIFGVYLFKDQVAPGWVTLSLQIASMFFFVFLILIALSEYVLQILEESQEHPLYHVEVDTMSKVSAGIGKHNVLPQPTLDGRDWRKTDAA
jgi:glycosyltransferase involved in cell wall biosynthesis